jgi:hypothetical protein
MDRVRGGVFSGAMVLAGISATLLSALLAIGIRQVTSLHQSRPLQVTMVPSSGEVAVPDATASPAPSHAASATSAPAYATLPHGNVPPRPDSRSAGSADTTTGSAAAGGSVAKPAPAKATSPPAAGQPKPSPTPAHSTPPPPTPSTTPAHPGNGHGHGHGHTH